MDHPEPTSLVREACLIDGDWLTGDAWTPVDNPATGAVIGRVPAFGAEEAQAAIDAAGRALPAWSARTGKDRAQILRRFFELMMQHQDALAAILTREQGKPLAEAKGEIAYAASFIEWFAEEAKRVYGDIIPGHAPDRRLVVIKQPIGVVAAITPWNFPAAMITRKIGPALAAGCTVVVKPAQQTPFTALALGVLAQEAGVPDGVLNIVTGDARAIGGVLTSSPVVRKLSFTGSTEVGALLYAQCAPTIKKLSLELGGNAPFIVFDDADVDAAVEGAMASKFRNAGQTCVCANRIYAQAEISRDQAGQFSLAYPGMTIEDAYAVQRAWVARKIADGRRLIGHKIGLTGRAMQRSSNISEPDYGALLDDMLFQDSQDIPISRFIVPRVEVELAFILKDRLTGPGLTLYDVLDATDYIVPAIEIIDARIQQIDPATGVTGKVFDTISDNAANAGLVLGGRPIKPMDVDLRWVSALLFRNGVIEDSGVAAAVLGHPAKGPAWLANKLAPYGEYLEAGEIVLGGSFTAPGPAPAGDTFHVDYGPLGSISVSFV